MSDIVMDILDEPDEDESESPEVQGDTSTATDGSDDETETQAEVEAPAPAAEAEVSEEPAPANPEGYKQDARGVWHRPDGTIASKEEVEKFATPETPPDPVAAPETPAVTEAPPATPAVPFRYRATGATHELPGATFVDGKLTAEGEGLSTIRQGLNALHVVPALQSENYELKRQLESRGPAESKADALVNALLNSVGIEDEEAAITEFFRLRAEMPKLMAQAEVDYWKSQAQRGAPRAEPEQQQIASLPAPDAAVRETMEVIEQFKVEGTFRGMTDADWQQIGESVQRTPYAFIRPATAEDAKQYDVAPGELVFDTDALAAHVQQHEARTLAAREADAAAKKAKEAAKFNALQSKPKPATPVRSTRPAPVTAGSNKPKDWESSFKGAWSDDDDSDE